MLLGDVNWRWPQKKPTAFDHLKQKLSNAPVLTRFSDELPLKLDTDESNYGVGAVNSHIYPNGEERAIAFANRTLNQSERNYRN